MTHLENLKVLEMNTDGFIMSKKTRLSYKTLTIQFKMNKGNYFFIQQ